MNQNFQNEVYESGLAASFQVPDTCELYPGDAREQPNLSVAKASEQSGLPFLKTVEPVAQTEQAAEVAAKGAESTGWTFLNITELASKADELLAKFDSLLAAASVPVERRPAQKSVAAMGNGNQLSEAGRAIFGFDDNIWLSA